MDIFILCTVIIPYIVLVMIFVKKTIWKILFTLSGCSIFLITCDFGHLNTTPIIKLIPVFSFYGIFLYYKKKVEPESDTNENK